MADAWVRIADYRATRHLKRFEEAFRFTPSVRPQDWPSFVEPAPSATWRIGHLLGHLDDETRVTPHNLALSQALRECLREDEPVLVLDPFHDCWELYPHRLRHPEVRRNWMVGALPNGEYHLFVTKDFRLGSLGHPWEQTLCVFGEEFLPAYRRLTPLGNEWLIRQRWGE